MLALVLRGFLQRKLRVLLTAIAIALGVALMAGTYILTDTINHSFANIFSTAFKGDSVVVSPAETLGSEIQSENSPITEQTLARVRAVPGVAEASGGIFSEGDAAQAARRKRLSTGGAPAFIVSVDSKRFESYTPVQGRYPQNANEVDLDQGTAKRERTKARRSDDRRGPGARASLSVIVGIVEVRRQPVLWGRRLGAADVGRGPAGDEQARQVRHDRRGRCEWSERRSSCAGGSGLCCRRR